MRTLTLLCLLSFSAFAEPDPPAEGDPADVLATELAGMFSTNPVLRNWYFNQHRDHSARNAQELSLVQGFEALSPEARNQAIDQYLGTDHHLSIGEGRNRHTYRIRRFEASQLALIRALSPEDQVRFLLRREVSLRWIATQLSADIDKVGRVGRVSNGIRNTAKAIAELGRKAKLGLGLQPPPTEFKASGPTISLDVKPAPTVVVKANPVTANTREEGIRTIESVLNATNVIMTARAPILASYNEVGQLGVGAVTLGLGWGTMGFYLGPGIGVYRGNYERADGKGRHVEIYAGLETKEFSLMPELALFTPSAKGAVQFRNRSEQFNPGATAKAKASYIPIPVAGGIKLYFIDAPGVFAVGAVRGLPFDVFGETVDWMNEIPTVLAEGAAFTEVVTDAAGGVNAAIRRKATRWPLLVLDHTPSNGTHVYLGGRRVRIPGGRGVAGVLSRCPFWKINQHEPDE